MKEWNNRKNAPLSKDNIQDAINIVSAEEEVNAYNINLDANNVTVDTFSQNSNTQKKMQARSWQVRGSINRKHWKKR